MRCFRLLIALHFIVIVFGCNTTTSLYHVDNIDGMSPYNDQGFNLDISIEAEQEIYNVTPEMISLINKHLVREDDYQQRAQKLVEMIFDHNYIGLAYDNSSTLTAEQTFKNKTANCLSLTIMAYALARQAGINVRFQDVKVPEYWERNGEYNLLTGHVNLTVLADKTKQPRVVYNSRSMFIDFDTSISRQNFPAEIVNQDTVTAMFYTNKGAQALVNSQYDIAYRYLKQATLVDPAYSPAWGNLGVLYRLNHMDNYALTAYQRAIFLNPNNLTAIDNLALLKFRLGEVEQANKLRASLHSIRRSNPHYQALLANEAFHAGNYELAVNRYRRAIKLDDTRHEFHYGLAKALHYVGQNSLAQRSMKHAIKLSPYPDTNERYVAKLAKMRYLSAN